jgi:Protein of unknown function (DUF2608)
MKKIVSFFSLFVLSLHSLLLGSLIEVSHFREILDYITPQTVFVLDIDETLFIPAQTLGSDVWFRNRIEDLKIQGTTPQTALDLALAEWEAIRRITDVKIVEEGTERVIQTMQEHGLKVMCMTTQRAEISTCTIQQLNALQMNFSKNGLFKQEINFYHPTHILFRQGILFTGGASKGAALLKFFDLIGYSPVRIVFINDKATHLIDVQQAVEKRGIDFVGLRYGYTDQKVASYNKVIADIQWKHYSLGHFLSDLEAEELGSVQ